MEGKLIRIPLRFTIITVFIILILESIHYSFFSHVFNVGIALFVTFIILGAATALMEIELEFPFSIFSILCGRMALAV